MTDNEIIKALECLKGSAILCKECPYSGKFLFPSCQKKVAKDSLDLINRQKAEIERLKARCENTQIGYNFAKDEIKDLKKDKYKLQKTLNQSEDYRTIAKSEAIKEFAERLKMEATVDDDSTWWIANVDIDNLVKEMVGENT